MTLGMPLYTYIGGKRTLLLGNGADFSAPVIDRIRSLGYSSVYVEEQGTDGLIPEDVLSDQTRDNALLTISKYFQEAKNTIENQVQKGRKLKDFIKSEVLGVSAPPAEPIRDCIKDLITDLLVVGSVKGYHSITGMSKTNYMINHSLNVAVISMLIGAHYKFIDSEQLMLGMGALLHDIGKTFLFDLAELHYWELEPEERTLLQEHAILGGRLLENLQTISEAERQIIIQHHERQDGTGYPHGLKGDNKKPLRTHYTEPRHMFRFAEIVAAANAFDNYLNGNYNQQIMTPSKALEELQKLSGTAHNRVVVNAIRSLVTLFPVCSNVRITAHSDPLLVGIQGVVSKSDLNGTKEVEVILLRDKHGRKLSPVRENLRLSDQVNMELIPS
jgi:HD-GYP domain-containing protein (c-di-GMP phosphodiesterase class II)